MDNDRIELIAIKYSDPEYLATQGHLPPLTEKERLRANADYDEWYKKAEREFFDRTSGEVTWQWAFYTYGRKT